MASYIAKYILKKETGQGNLLKGIEDESAKHETSADMKLKTCPITRKYLIHSNVKLEKNKEFLL